MVFIVSTLISLVLTPINIGINLIRSLFGRIFQDRIRKMGLLISLIAGILLSEGSFLTGLKYFLLSLYFYYLVVIGWFIRKYYNTNLAAFFGVLKVASLILVFDLLVGISIFEEPLLFMPIANAGGYELMPFFGFASLTGLLASRQLARNSLIQFVIKWSITGLFLLVLAWWLGAIEDLPALISRIVDFMGKLGRAIIEIIEIFSGSGGTTAW